MLDAGLARMKAGRVAVLQFVYPAVALAVDGRVYGRVLGGVQRPGVALMAGALLSARPRSGGRAGTAVL